MASNRIFYAVKAGGFAPLGDTSPTKIHGLQSVNVTTTFNLEDVFEIGQICLYENIEDIPDVEVQLTKVLDGYPPMYTLATENAGSATLAGRSNVRTNFIMSIYDDDQDAASGTAQSEVHVSGAYVDSLSYTMPVQGNCTEELTLVSNDKQWRTSGFLFTGVVFDCTDTPLAITGSGGVQRRENVTFSNASLTAGTLLGPEILGISSSGTNDTVNNHCSAKIQTITVATSLNRQSLYCLGQKKPYHRFAQFPAEVTTDVEVIATDGDLVNAKEDEDNTVDRTMRVVLDEGLRIELGTKNRLRNVSFGGGDTGGGNDTITYSYRNANDMTVTHPQDPTTALR